MIDRSLARTDMSRRRFLGWGVGGIFAAMAAIIGIPAVKYLSAPSFKAESSVWTSVARLDEVKPGQPTLFKVSIEKKSGWLRSEREVSVYLDTQDGRNFTALSNICTHLGCPLRWDSGKHLFLCPCHNGAFDRDGNVVSGPPPRPMDRFQTKVEGGKLLIIGG